MMALQYAEYGPPEVLRVVDVEEPHAVAGQIRVAVKAVGVNPVDWKVRKGLMKGALPAIPGSDVAGVVDEVGADVAGVSAGEEVFGFAVSGGAAQLAVVGPCRRACPSPRRRGYRWRSRPRFGSSGCWGSPPARPCSSMPPPAAWASPRCSSPGLAASA